MDNLFNLEGRTAFITGGGGLLGPEHAIGLARFGAHIILADIYDAGLEIACRRVLESVPGASVEKVVIDITDESAISNFQKNLQKREIAVDILVNNAALNPKMDTADAKESHAVHTYDMDYWNAELKVGITGVFLCCKIFGHVMAERGKGAIINVASELALQAPDQRIYSPTGKIEDVTQFKPIGYSVVKSAMLGLNRYLASYWAHKGVRVNCLVPTAVYNHQPQHLVEQVKRRIPLGRWADRSDYQGAIAFLASDASSYMTGQTLVIDGGRTIW